MRSSLLLGALGLAASVSARISPIKRHEDGDCSPNPAGVPGYTNNPDTADTFLNNPAYSNAANGASTPSGYTEVFQNDHAAILDNGAYLGYDNLQTYDVSYCAQRCNSAWPGCSSFDIYFEREATIDPGVNCTNPPSLTYIRCAYYSACETQADATNVGQYCADFHIVIAGSNLYTLDSKCSSASSSTTTATSSMATQSSSTQVATTSASSVVSQPSTMSTVATTPASSSTTSPSSAPTCATCVPGSFTDDNGKQYTVSCNTNFWGDDLGAVAASCYQECFDICDKNPQCNAFSWDPTAPPTSCWPKNIPAGSSAQPYSEQNVVFAQMVPACTACSSGKVTDDNGKQYNVQCNTNFWGSDLGPVAASCYEECFDICDKNPQCNAFSWDPTAPPTSCWPKNIPAGTSAKPYSDNSVVFAQMLPTCAACVNGPTTDGSGASWQVLCGSNFWGSDLVQQTASCSDDCFDLCDQHQQCNSFVWNDSTSTCWLKDIPCEDGQTPQTHPESDTTFAWSVVQGNSKHGSGNQGSSNQGSGSQWSSIPSSSSQSSSNSWFNWNFWQSIQW